MFRICQFHPRSLYMFWLFQIYRKTLFLKCLKNSIIKLFCLFVQNLSISPKMIFGCRFKFMKLTASRNTHLNSGMLQIISLYRHTYAVSLMISLLYKINHRIPPIEIHVYYRCHRYGNKNKVT